MSISERLLLIVIAVSGVLLGISVFALFLDSSDRQAWEDFRDINNCMESAGGTLPWDGESVPPVLPWKLEQILYVCAPSDGPTFYTIH